MAFLTVLAIFVGSIVWYWTTYNQLVAARNSTDHSWSNIEVELKRRFDLIGNLIEVVKGYTGHENSTLQSVTAARSAHTEFPSAHEGNVAQSAIAASLGQIFMLAESYPDLKANTQFLSLQDELANTENRIAERREAYNQTVNLYLNLLRSFPSSFVGSLHAFIAREFFEAPDKAVYEAPKVSLQ